MRILGKRKSVIIIMIIAIISIGIWYYAYSKENQNIFEINANESQDEGNILNNDVTKEENFQQTNLIVHISGAVNYEGIVELNQNSRISDAIEKAGGLKDNACLDDINLAYILEDGMKVYIPTKEENIDSNKNENSKENLNQYVSSKNNEKIVNESNTISLNSSNRKETKVNINTATEAKLQELPGIGESTAKKIVKHREENGRFKKIEDIKNVNGIGESKYNNIKDLISI